jgi:hypothetical protein
MLGDNEVQHIVSAPAAEVINPGVGLMLNSDNISVQQAQGTRSDTTTVLALYGWSILTTAKEGVGNSNASTAVGGAQFQPGDMVPVLRRGCIYAYWKGTAIPTYNGLGVFNIYQSSTVATDRGKLTDAAAASTATAEIGPVGTRVQPRPVLPALAGTGNVVLVDISYPGAA